MSETSEPARPTAAESERPTQAGPYGWAMRGLGVGIGVGVGGGAGVGAVFGAPGAGAAVGALLGVVIGSWFSRRLAKRVSC